MALGSAGAVTEMQRHYLSIIKTNADRLSDIVNDLLASVADRGRQAHMNFQAISLQRVIFEVVVLLQKKL